MSLSICGEATWDDLLPSAPFFENVEDREVWSTVAQNFRSHWNSMEREKMMTKISIELFFGWGNGFIVDLN